MLTIPRVLYRGDADKHNIRNLKATLHFRQLQTNLLSGGNGHEIFTTPVVDLIAQHVDPGWASTHFLSFSEDRITAMRFGLGCKYEDVDQSLENYESDYELKNDWTFALITIQTNNISWQQCGEGIYHGHYEPGLIKFAFSPGRAYVFLIDVKNAIKAFPQHPNYSTVLANATRDKEWLLLPASPAVFNGGKVEYSGIMDGGCISTIEMYKLIKSLA